MLGRSITGEAYERVEEGPAPQGLAAAFHALRGNYAEAERDYREAKQRRIVALREADLSAFSGQEIALFDGILSDVRETGQPTELRDRFPAWQIAEIGEEIPYSTVFVGQPRPLTSGV